MTNINESFKIATLGENTIDYVKVIVGKKSVILITREELVKIIGSMEDRLFIGIEHWEHYGNCLLIKMKVVPNEVQFTDPDLIELFFKSMKFDTTQEVANVIDYSIARIKGEIRFYQYAKMGALK